MLGQPKNRAERIKEFLDQWRGVPDDYVILYSTIGVYDQPTGILMGDIREMHGIVSKLDRLSAETVSGDSPVGRLLGRLEKPDEETGSGYRPPFSD